MTTWNTTPFLKNKVKTSATLKVKSASPVRNKSKDYELKSYLEVSLSQLKTIMK